MKDKVKGLIIGIAIGSMLTGVTAFAANGTAIKAVMQKMNIYIDGTKKSNSDVINYKGATYVPIRAVGSAIGKQVGLHEGNLYIGKQPDIKITEKDAINLLYKKIKKDADKYKLHFMVDNNEGDRYVIRVYEDFSDHIATYGWFYVYKNTGKVTKNDIVSGEEVEF